MLEQILKENTNKMIKIIDSAKIEISKLSPHFANPSILSDVLVEYYGSHMSILQLAKINVIDGRQFFIKPYDRKLIPNIASAIIKKNLGFFPEQNADSIIIKIPQVTEEKRKEIVKRLHSIVEDYKVLIRNVRRNANQIVKKNNIVSKDEQKDLEERIQELTDKYIKELTNISIKKEKEILTI